MTYHSEPVAPVDLVSVTPSEEQVEEASLALEFLLGNNEDETVAWIAADHASARELTTGTITSKSAEKATLSADRPIVHSLTDDALPFEEYLLP